MSMPATSKRRWFQFSLTSLLALMTLVAIWLAWELAFIRERRAWLREHPALIDDARVRSGRPLMITVSGDLKLQSNDTLVLTTPTPSREVSLPPWRKWLGDTAVATILDPGFSDEVRADARRLFPEAELFTPTLSQSTGTLTYSFGVDPALPASGAGDNNPNLPVEKPE
jgi:hypothetical protein